MLNHKQSTETETQLSVPFFREFTNMRYTFISRPSISWPNTTITGEIIILRGSVPRQFSNHFSLFLFSFSCYHIFGFFSVCFFLLLSFSAMAWLWIIALSDLNQFLLYSAFCFRFCVRHFDCRKELLSFLFNERHQSEVNCYHLEKGRKVSFFRQ